MPKITVILPVYNASAYIKECVDSLMRQTYADFEVLIFDDASTDDSVSIIERTIDSRCRLIKSEKNQGYVVHLQRGINEARGEYIARMDADDICLSDRFQHQVSYLDAHPEVGIVGGSVIEINENGDKISTSFKPENDWEIRWASLLDNPFWHPTIMLRGDVLGKHQLNYRSEYLPTEDFELWGRMLEHCKGYNIQDPLVRYRRHAGQESQAKRDRQLNHHVRISQRQIQRLLGRDIEKGIVESLVLWRVGDRRAPSSCNIGMPEVYWDMLEIFSKMESEADLRWKSEKRKELMKFLVENVRQTSVLWAVIRLLSARRDSWGVFLKRCWLQMRKCLSRLG